MQPPTPSGLAGSGQLTRFAQQRDVIADKLNATHREDTTMATALCSGTPPFPRESSRVMRAAWCHLPERGLGWSAADPADAIVAARVCLNGRGPLPAAHEHDICAENPGGADDSLTDLGQCRCLRQTSSECGELRTATSLAAATWDDRTRHACAIGQGMTPILSVPRFVLRVAHAVRSVSGPGPVSSGCRPSFCTIMRRCEAVALVIVSERCPLQRSDVQVQTGMPRTSLASGEATEPKGRIAVEFRYLGNSGFKISEITCGNWLTHGSQVENDQAKACVRAALEAGISTFDTADAYASTMAETVLGEALKGEPRESLEILTKVYWPTGPGHNDVGLSRMHIMESINGSLSRLQTDDVDLYQAHRYDYDTPLDETMQVFADLVWMGKVLHVRVSEWTPSRSRTATTSRATRHPPDLQPAPVFDAVAGDLERRRIGLRLTRHPQIVFSPIAQGVHTGKYRPGEQPAGSRAADEKGGADMIKRSAFNLTVV